MRRLPHVPALDGLRGVAVVGVLAFHLGHLRGGYLGVDLFFVLSGFLITSLLLAERTTTGRIALGAFWARRARRLLPALFLVIGAIAVYASTRPDGVALGALRGDALATLGYIANWHSIVTDHGYWDLFAAPSLLAHTWSLAIEEQLYVVWPLVVVGALRFGRRALLAVAVALAGASALTMAVLHGAGDDTTRVYFGTDTRASSVLVGAALAIVISLRGGQLGARRPVALVGAVAAVGLGVAWFTVAGTTDGLYEGGFLLCGLAGVALIAAALQPGPLATVLSFPPLRRLGEISYGVYLWHWPVFVVLTPDRAGVHGWPLLVVKLAVTFAVSVVSYRLVERPIRHGSLRGWRIRTLAPVAAVAVVVAVVVGVPEVAVASRPAPTAAAPLTPVSTIAPVAGMSRLLVVGDSGSAFLGEGLARVGPSEDVAVRNAGTIACGIVTVGGGVRLPDGPFVADPKDCDQWPARWDEELASFNPDTTLLLIGWPGIGDRKVDGDWRHPCDPAFDRYYASEVTRAVGVLQPSTRVVIATVPYLTLPVIQSDAAQRVDCLNAVYRDVASATGAGVLPLGEWLCRDARHCTIEEDGVTLRPDGVHFEDDGADIAARWVVPALTDAGQE